MNPRSRTSSARGSRLWGVDCARAVALLGMFAVHVLPLSDPGTGAPTWAGEFLAGRSAALFAVLAGVGLALLSGGTSPHRSGVKRGVRMGTAVRAALIILIGLTVSLLQSGVAIILVHYGVMFLLALPFLRLSFRGLALLAGAWALLGPVLWRFAQLQLRQGLEPLDQPERLWISPNVFHLLNPADLPTLGLDLIATGYYPLLIWPAFFFAGMALGRIDLSRTTIPLRLLLGGAVLAALTWGLSSWVISSTSLVTDVAALTGDSRRTVSTQLITGDPLMPLVLDDRWFFTAVPHQGSPTEVLHTIGSAAAMLGACLLLVRLLPGPLAWLVTPLAGAGAMPLTLYVGHLVVLSQWRPAGALLGSLSPEQLLLGLVLAALIAGTVKMVLGRRGPLEAILHAASSRASQR